MVFISVPCKKGSEVNLVKPIESYIKGNLGASQAVACKKGLEHLQRTRNEILVKLNDSHESTAHLLVKYCDLLENLEHRIPLTSEDIPISFKWYDCFAPSSKIFKSSMKGLSGGFDRSCMVFNLAACHSQIAANHNTADDADLKSAAKAFQTSAGMFDYVKTLLPTCYSQSPTWDMSSEALNAYATIMIAQAQECIFMKAERDDMKPIIVAKLANQAATLYSEALTACSLNSLKPYLNKDWPSYLSGKVATMELYAEYHGAFAAEAEQSYGEQIARFNKAMVLVKKVPRSDQIKQLSSKIERACDTAKKDNELIYHELVPDPKTLAPLGVAVVAKKAVITFPLAGEPPKDYFKVLVPIPVHNALQVAEGVRKQMIGVEVGRLREATNMCNGVMASLGLPAAVQKVTSDISEGGLPKALAEKAALVRSKGGVDDLREKVASLLNGTSRNDDIVKDIASTLDEEEKTDNELRSQYGEKWNRLASSKLNSSWRAEVLKHQELLKQSGQTDQSLKTRLADNETAFGQLSLPEPELGALVKDAMADCSSPTGNTGGSKMEKLRSLCTKVETLKSERTDLQKQLEEITLPEGLSADFLKSYKNGDQIDAQAVASEHVNAGLESARDCVRESLNNQEGLLAEIQTKYEAVFGKSKADTTLVTTLLMAAEVFEQLMSDVGEGIKFYADLTGILLKFQNKVNDFSFARQTEKKELMKDISKDMSRPAPAEVPSRPPPTYMSSTPTAPPPAAPPTAMPPPGAAASAPFAAPPPFNPYAGMVPPMYWPPYGMMQPGQPGAPPTQGMAQMYGMYGCYPMPMPGIPPQNPPQ